ncbi:hypothetical protein HY68_27260 [Streptomyces sp. AcH 505]|nr:hypothetical protein HY68_27260 [Streptomyces sp. AcH 505]
MRSPIRRRYATLVALSVGIVITAGCGGDVSGQDASDAKELFLQPVAPRGPDPFTGSTAVRLPKGATPTAKPSTGARTDPDAASRAARSLPGSTPGLYGGTEAKSSCDVERQVRFLTEDHRKARAFAQGAAIGDASVPSFLRGLTPVTLRADTRVTSHGYHSGSATSFQSVLQAGTAVLVDDHGLPRVRCACGNPLRPAVAMQGGVTHRGKPWSGYRPERVVVITRAPRTLTSLVVVNALNDTWLQRPVGSDGDQDGPPVERPPYAPGADITDPGAVKPPEPEPSGEAPATPSPAEPPVPSPVEPSTEAPSDPSGDVVTPDIPPGPSDQDTPPGPDGDLPPMPDAPQPDGDSATSVTFQG